MSYSLGVGRSCCENAFNSKDNVKKRLVRGTNQASYILLSVRFLLLYLLLCGTWCDRLYFGRQQNTVRTRKCHLLTHRCKFFYGKPVLPALLYPHCSILPGFCWVALSCLERCHDVAVKLGN